MTWNQDRESIIAAAELGDAPAKTAAALLVDARKRAHDAARECEAHKTAALRLREDLVERTSERDAAREEVKTLRHNLMAITAQEQERMDQLAMAEAACRRDATALGVVLADLAALKAAHAWIKTSERKPEVQEGDCCDVLAVVSEQVLVLNYTNDDGVHPWVDEFSNLYQDYEVTHWMPLPEAPK